MAAGSQDSVELLADFAAEAGDALHSVPDELRAFHEDPNNADAINAVFRAVHSIKGNAGFFGLVAIKTFAHRLENTLDDIRKQKVELTDDLLRELIAAIDRLDEMVAGIMDADPADPLSPEDQQQLERITQLSNSARVEVGREERLFLAVMDLVEQMRSATDSGSSPKMWADQFAELIEEFRQEASGGDTTATDPNADATAPATEPADLRLKQFRIGERDITEDVLAMLELFVDFQAGESGDRLVTQFFETAERLAPLAKDAGDKEFSEALQKAVSDLKTIVNSPLDLDATLVSVAWDHIAPHVIRLQVDSDKSKESKEAAASGGGSPNNEARGAKNNDTNRGRPRLIRVREEKLDEFLEDVSSLFITCELFKDLHSRMVAEGQPSPLLDEMRQVTRSFSEQSTALQKSLVALRQLAVSGLFSRFPRLARSIASQLEKQVDVQLVGEDTEIDKALVEQLDAPLTHMIRNSVDHGIEAPDVRRECGKPETGRIWLKAEKTRSHVVITIQDDGAGIDPAKMRKKAVEKGVLSPDEAAALSDHQAQELIFHPGFSTAEKVSDVSGRGVGMDVVRTAVQELNGELILQSEVGVGTTFRMEFPLREAVLVIDGLMLEHCGQQFIVPFEHIREIAEVDPKGLQRVQDVTVVNVRGETYHAVSLSEVLDLPDMELAPGQRVPAVLVECRFGTLCLLAEQLYGHRQVVVNGLRTIFPGLDNLAGVAPLGGGQLALVLSITDIIRHRKQQA